MDREGILNSTQIGFSRECSIWIAHAIFDNLIGKSIKAEELSALVTLGIAKAYDSLEHSIILRSPLAHNVPHYIVSWARLS